MPATPEPRLAVLPKSVPIYLIVPIKPTLICGPWKAGWALDVHVIASDFIGYDPFGNPQFDTLRSEIGEQLFQLKYRGNRQVLASLGEAVARFVRQQQLAVDVIVAAPPSDDTRPFQPLMEIAKTVAAAIGAPHAPDAVKKVKRTDQLKDVKELAQRSKLLAGAFQADAGALNGKHILLLDDLYRSGATLSAVSQAIVRATIPASLHVIAMTRTVRRR